MTVCLHKPGFPDRYFAGLETVIKNVPLGGATIASGVSELCNTLSTNSVGSTALRSVYNSYIVHRARISVTFVNFLTTQPLRVLVTPLNAEQSQSLPLANDDDFCELKFAKTAVCSISGGGKDVQKVTVDVDLNSLLGSNTQFQAPFISGFTGSSNSTVAFTSPANNFTFYVSISSISGTNTGVNAAFATYSLYQEVEFYDRLAAGF